MFEIKSDVMRKLVGDNEKTVNFKNKNNKRIIEYLFSHQDSYNQLYHDCFSQLSPQLEKEIEIVLECLEKEDEALETQIGAIELFLSENTANNGYCNHLSAIDLACTFCLPAMFYFAWETGGVWEYAQIVEKSSDRPSRGYRPFSGSHVEDRCFEDRTYRKEFYFLIKEYLERTQNKYTSADLCKLLLQIGFDIQEYDWDVYQVNDYMNVVQNLEKEELKWEK